MQVLVIAQKPYLSRCYAALLAAWHYDVKAAHTFLGAVQAAAEQRPDMILFDASGLPGGAADEVAHLASRTGATVIALLNWTECPCPFANALTKPIDPEELRTCLSAVAESRAAATPIICRNESYGLEASVP